MLQSVEASGPDFDPHLGGDAGFHVDGRGRRGALLIVTLVMLSLFLLLGTTYIISASQRRPRTIGATLSQSTIWAARDVARNAPTVSGPPLEFDDLLENPPPAPDSENPVARRKVVEATRREAVNRYIDSSLLFDKYGTKYARFRLTGIREFAAPQPGGGSLRFFEITLALPLVPVAPAFEEGPPFAGRIVSISGPERNAVFRVLAEVQPESNTPRLLVHQLNPSAPLNIAKLPQAADVCIQGREFAGDPERPGELNEAYDAPDKRNPFLTWEQTEAILGPDEIPDSGDPSAVNPADAPSHPWRYVIPAFHRPDRLLAALKSSGAGNYREAWLDYENLRALDFPNRSLLLLRPAGRMEFAAQGEVDWGRYGLPGPPPVNFLSPPEHPEFTGSNITIVNGRRRYFDPINGPWDVDNDGDGVRDSVWLDIGVPEVEINGERCRPLVAIKIVDLDSRLNVNAHGSLAESEFGSNRLALNPDESLGAYYAGTDPAAANPAELGAALRRGIGWGVADVDLAHLFEATLPRDVPAAAGRARAVELLRRLLAGTASTTPSAEGRYGDSRNGDGPLRPAPGRRDQADVGLDAPQGTPLRYRLFATNYGRAVAGPGSPVDPFGIMQVGSDQMGQPLYSRFRRQGAGRSPWNIDAIDHPYEISVGRAGPRPGWMYDPDVPRPDNEPSVFADNLFTAPQLERVLRLYEGKLDAVSPRLVSLLGPAAAAARLTTTAESWDSTAICVPRGVLDPILELSDQADRDLPSLISWDVQLGLRMDLNRPFGDGVDNDQNGIVDEPGEPNDFGLTGDIAVQCLTNGRKVNGNGQADRADATRCRELFARHLFVLGMKATPRKDYWDRLGGDDRIRYRRAMAQWAVNVVDFRDPDSIMTRFQYDDRFAPDSTDWQIVEPDPETDEQGSPVVWGCERPEVLLTEAMAWRNIEETQTRPSVYEYRDDDSGGLVIELYHPWTSLTDEGLRGEPLPAELMSDPAKRYRRDGTIDLAKLNPAEPDPAGNRVVQQPVFQIVVVPDNKASTDSLRDDPSWPGPSDDVDAVIYLGDAGGGNDAFAARQPFSAAGATPGSDLTSLRPGQFAVIAGPADAGEGKLVCPMKGDGGDAQAGLELVVEGFSDREEMQPLRLSEGLQEQITGSVGYPRFPNQRSTAKALPGDRDSGPVGAVIRVSRNSGQPLVLPASPGGRSTELGTVFNPKEARRRIILRRLANPLLAYNQNTNPYIAIDSMVVQEQGVIYGQQGGDGAEPTQITLRSTERGAAQTPAEGKKNLVNNLWRQDDGDADASMPNPARYQGVEFCGRRAADNTVEASFGFLPAALVVPGPGKTDVPPFPLLTWPNRDFVSAHEVLLVPGESPANLLRRHSHAWPFRHLYFGGGPLDDDAEPDPLNPAKPDSLQARLGILEFLRVPSRFADAELPLAAADSIQLNVALEAAGFKPLFLPPHNYVSHFREPGRVNLNTLSSRAVWAALNGGRPGTAYEDEFRVGGNGKPLAFARSEDWTNEDPLAPQTGNWNLDRDEDANGNGYLDLNDDLNNDGRRSVGTTMTIASSRRGWELPDVQKPEDLDALPQNHFAAGYDRVLNRRGIDGDNDQWFLRPFTTGWTAAADSYEPGDSLLMRGSAAEEGPPGRRPRLLFSTDSSDPDPKSNPNGGADPEEPQPGGPRYRDPARSPAFYFADVVRLSNLVTPRSNVFAVWWTIGFFKLDAEGRLGAEYGLETGDNARHKKFMIIDRSIPVGFTPFGDPGTSGETILLERFTP